MELGTTLLHSHTHNYTQVHNITHTHMHTPNRTRTHTQVFEKRQSRSRLQTVRQWRAMLLNPPPKPQEITSSLLWASRLVNYHQKKRLKDSYWGEDGKKYHIHMLKFPHRQLREVVVVLCVYSCWAGQRIWQHHLSISDGRNGCKLINFDPVIVQVFLIS